MFCPNCLTEYRAGFEVCADCGAPLTDAAPALRELPDVNTRNRGLFAPVLSGFLAAGLLWLSTLLPVPRTLSAFESFNDLRVAWLMAFLLFALSAFAVPLFTVPAPGPLTPRWQFLLFVAALFGGFVVAALGLYNHVPEPFALAGSLLWFGGAAAVNTAALQWFLVTRRSGGPMSLAALVNAFLSSLLLPFMSWSAFWAERVQALIAGNA